jgi:flagellum-specific peptidoglycan hydrolase FlgJ
MKYQPKHLSNGNRQSTKRPSAIDMAFTVMWICMFFILAILITIPSITKSMSSTVDAARAATTNTTRGVESSSNDSISFDYLVSRQPLDVDFFDSLPEMSSEPEVVEDNGIETPTDDEYEMAVESDPEPEVIEEDPTEVVEDAQYDYYHEAFSTSSIIISDSGLDADQINGLVSGSGLEGLGSAIDEIEETYGVNAFYTLAVAALESGRGTSTLATTKNNLFGLINCTFKSKESCIQYFGKLMIKYRDTYGVTMTPEGINPTYCETDTWAGKVVTLMNEYVTKANDLY